MRRRKVFRIIFCVLLIFCLSGSNFGLMETNITGSASGVIHSYGDPEETGTIGVSRSDGTTVTYVYEAKPTCVKFENGEPQLGEDETVGLTDTFIITFDGGGLPVSGEIKNGVGTRSFTFNSVGEVVDIYYSSTLTYKIRLVSLNNIDDTFTFTVESIAKPGPTALSYINFCFSEKTTPEPETLTLTPETSNNQLPQDKNHQFTATVKDQHGSPMENINVSFHTDFGNFSDTNTNYTQKTTDTNGEAKVTIVSSTPGTATIRAWIDNGDQTYTTGEITDTSTKNWNPPIPEPETLTLTPETSNNQLPQDKNHQFTATVQDQYENPMQNINISFTTDFGTFQNNQQYIEIQTNTQGQATVTITSNTPGTATTRAWIDNGDQTYTTGEITDTSTKNWNPPTPPPPQPKGTIIVQKDANPNAPQNFQFIGDLGTFNLDDDTNPALPNQQTFTNLNPGIYTITEIVPTGWILESINFTDPTDDSTSTKPSAIVNLASGETITVKFTNVKTYPITIVKNTVPDSGKDFEFTGDLGTFYLDDDTDPTLPNSRTFWMPPGTYVVDETKPTPYHYPSIIIQNDDDGGSSKTLDNPYATATIDLDAGEEITVIFKNTKPARLIIVKDAIPNHPQNFKFRTYTGWTGDLSMSGYLGPDTVLDDDSDNTLLNTSTLGTGPGKYRIVEGTPGVGSIWNIGPPQGWNLINIEINDPDGESYVDGSIAYVDLDAGEHVRVKFTNKQDEIPDTLKLTPDSATNILPDDTSHIFTATVQDQYENPMQNIKISFTTDFGTFQNNQQYIEIQTNTQGQATITIKSNTPGTATIRAWIDNGDQIYTTGEITDTSTKNWDQPEPETLTLTPETANNRLPQDTNHQFTATVKDQHGSPMENINVSFHTDFGNFSDTNTNYTQKTTDNNGEAKVTIVSSTPGTATIRAWIDNGDQTHTTGEITDTSTKNWEAPTSLTIWKTVNTEWYRAYNWSITKTVTPNFLILNKSETGTVTYTIEVTRELVSEKYTVHGTIYAENDIENNARILKVEDAIEQRLPGLNSWNEITRKTIANEDSIPAGDTAEWDYEITFTPISGATYRNVAYVTLANHPAPGGGIEEKTYLFRESFDLPTSPTKEEDATASIVDEQTIPTGFSTIDDYPYGGWTANNDKMFAINKSIINNNADPGTYYVNNTATLTEDDTKEKHNATASVEIKVPSITLTLDPETSINILPNSLHNITSTVLRDGQPLQGVPVSFKTDFGNFIGAPGDGTYIEVPTNSLGKATVTINSTSPGTATINAWVDEGEPGDKLYTEGELAGDPATKTWQQPGISIEKQVWNPETSAWTHDIQVKQGTNLTFRILIHNTGSAILHNIQVRDTMSKQLAYKNAANYTPIESSSNQIKWYFKSLNPQETIEIKFHAEAIILCQGWNKVNISTDETEPIKDTVMVKVNSPDRPDISIQKKVFNESSQSWEDSIKTKVSTNLSFQLIIRNTGNVELTDIEVIDRLPGFLTYNHNANPAPNQATSSYLKWKIDTLSKYQSKTITFTAYVKASGESNNVATITAKYENTTLQKQDKAHILVLDLPKPDIKLIKEVWDNSSLSWSDDIRVPLGTNIKFRITIINTGEVILQDIYITDEMALQLEYRNDANYTPTTVSPNNIQWYFEELDINEKKEIMFHAEAVTPCQGYNKALVKTAQKVSDEDTVLVKVFTEDIHAPVTTLEFGEPFYDSGSYERITTNTPIWLNATDYPSDNPSGINYTYYRVLRNYGNKIEIDWTIYTGPFTIPNPCYHIIEYYSVDNACNQEETKTRQIKVLSS